MSNEIVEYHVALTHEKQQITPSLIGTVINHVFIFAKSPADAIKKAVAALTTDEERSLVGVKVN